MGRVLLVLFGIIAMVVAGVVAMLFAGLVAGIVVAVLVIGLTVWALRAEGGAKRGAVTGIAVLFFVAVGLAGWQAAALASAFGNTSGPVDDPDPEQLASAEAKLSDVEDEAGFRLELEEGEVTALIQGALAEANTPLRSIALDVDPADSALDFTGTFKSGDLTINGSVAVTAVAGGIDVTLLSADVGAMSLPGAVAGAVEDIVSGVADFSGALAEAGASIQSVEFTESSVVLIGTQRGGELLTSEILLDTLASQAAGLSGAVEPPPERLGPGTVNDITADGPSYYVALGDSLAANVGVTEPRDGYVSRFHAELVRRDGTEYGLRNFGIPGETSGSLLRGGQLEEALEFVSSNQIAYVTIDIGANDLLGHMGSPDCGDDLTTPACQNRIEDTLVAYEQALGEILDRVTTAAPDATVIFLQTYNPFSLGLSSFVEFERTSDEIVSELNRVAADVASPRGVIVADSFTPMQGTTAATTHMTDDPPDIHPQAIGFDIMAFALVEALEG